MPACAYCGLRPRIEMSACEVCRPRIGQIIFGSRRGPDGFVIPQDQFHYGEPVQADIYFREAPRVENLLLFGRHSNPRPDHSGGLRVEEPLYMITDRFMKRTFVASPPNTAFFRDRNHFVAGDAYDVLAQHGPGRCQIRYERTVTRMLMAAGSFELVD